MLKFAILAGTSAIYATVLDQIAASIILWVSALTALSLFMRKWGRPIFRKYIKPQARLTEHMDRMERESTEQAEGLAEIREQQGRITAEIAATKAKIEALEVKQREAYAEESKTLGRIEKGAEMAGERAQSAINIAEAVRRQLGVAARGDPEKGPE